MKEQTIFRVKFSTTKLIPQGYEIDNGQVDVLKKASVGALLFELNTLDRFNRYSGFTQYLKSSYPNSHPGYLDLPCKAIRNLIPKENS